MLLAAKVWHYWLSFFLLVPVALIVIAIAVGYLVRVKSTRYPRQ